MEVGGKLHALATLSLGKIPCFAHFKYQTLIFQSYLLILLHITVLCWHAFLSQNEENFFWQFVRGFVSIWTSQLDLDWSRLPDWLTVKHDSGPLLPRLPLELLPAIEKFTYLAKEETEKVVITINSLYTSCS
jgi:hypothetical protein